MRFEKDRNLLKAKPFNRDTTMHKVESEGTKLSITLSKPRVVASQDLTQKYGVDKYNLSEGYSLPESLKELVPQGTSVLVDRGQKYTERIMRALHYFKQCSLVGPSGTGKTHAAYLVAEIAGLPLWEVNCGLQTSVYDLFGRFVGLGKENWVDGQIVSWCRYGGILYLDEANMMKQDVATRMNPLLDTRGHLVLTEKDNEIIPRHPFGYVVITLNPYSSEFAGTKPLNAAFRRRMSVWIDFDYLSLGTRIAKEEVKIVSERGMVGGDIATRIVRVGAELRRQYKEGELPYAPSVSDLANWALLVSDGSSPTIAAEETVVTLSSDNPEVQDSIRRVVKMIFADQRVRQETGSLGFELS